MASITCTRIVRAPLDAVFAAATDLRNTPAHIPAITRLEVLTDGPVRKGTRFRETRVMFGREHTEEMEITEFQAPKSYVVGCDSHGCRYRTEFRFTPKDGGTEIAMQFEAVPLTFPAKVMSFLMKPMMKKMAALCTKDLDGIAAAVER